MTAAVYVASKSGYGGMWQEARSAFPGLRFTSTWIDEWEEGASADLTDLWVRCVAEVLEADVLIAYHAEGEVWKGAFVEIGAALGAGIPVCVVGDPPGSWVGHPLVHRAASVAAALEAVQR